MASRRSVRRAAVSSGGATPARVRDFFGLSVMGASLHPVVTGSVFHVEHSAQTGLYSGRFVTHRGAPMTFNRLVYHEYVEVRADAPIFSQDFIDWMNDHNDGPAVSIDRDSGRGGQGWQQAIEMAKKAIDEMLAREGGMIPPHELIKAQNAKNALDALKATLQSGTPQQKVAALEAAIAAARTLAMLPGLGVFGLAVANCALTVL